MCTSKGAPKHPDNKKVNDDVREGANALWELMQKKNAVFVADSGFNEELEKFLKEHRISRNKKPSAKQNEYIKVVESGLKSQPSIVS